ncbi:hypothetical protein BSN82_06910 [Acinetobacter baylyi]|uniref:Uncharacterized protein n=2 Tax=Acinetobacter baylyi TaxID=202950 RepID=Q6F869_ACIAD|nr:hypothetical protein BSL88_11985 [Acinetobacter baylyi]MAK31283.1 hypothetical protein [Acinetobacter sp.]CAG69746.1 hypothetical protein ACIAD3045 [Acinetobacter baylyi ADP1]KAF2371338.1 hypothetical protein BSL67_16315 [Acinetobacter baylyi]KAF2378149.1 hypothetical protein BSN81_04990 [Acinetobacter baylyi]
MVAFCISTDIKHLTAGHCEMLFRMIGMTEEHLNIQNPKQWSGLNLLGFVLIHVWKSLKITDDQQD